MNATRTTFTLFLLAFLAVPCAIALAKPAAKDKEPDDAPTADAAAAAEGEDARPAAKDKSNPVDGGNDAKADARRSDAGAEDKKAKRALKKPAVAIDPSEPGTIEGLVLDKKKAPLAGVTVALYGKRKGDKEASNIDEAVVGGDGSFTLQGPPGAYRVIVTDNDVKLGTRSVRIKPGGTSKVEMRLSRKQRTSDGDMKGGGKKNDKDYGGGGITDIDPADRAMDRRSGNRRPGSGPGPAENRAGGRSAGGRSGGGGGPGR